MRHMPVVVVLCDNCKLEAEVIVEFGDRYQEESVGEELRARGWEVTEEGDWCEECLDMIDEEEKEEKEE